MFTRSTNSILKSLEKNVTALQRREDDMDRKATQKGKEVDRAMEEQNEAIAEAGRAKRAANKIANLIS